MGRLALYACLLFYFNTSPDDFPLAKRPEKAADITQHHYVLSNEWKNSVWQTCHYPNMGNASDFLRQISFAEWTVRSTTHIWLVISNTSPICISAFFLQTSLHRATSGGVGKCGMPVFSGYTKFIFRRYLYSKPTIPNLPFTRTLQIETLSILAAIWSGVWDAFPVMLGLQSSRLRKAWRTYEK